eukprot:5290200-Prymnesium_polylepis.1
MRGVPDPHPSPPRRSPPFDLAVTPHSDDAATSDKRLVSCGSLPASDAMHVTACDSREDVV